MIGVIFIALFSIFFGINAEKSHAIARYGKPAYEEGSSFSFVNLNAPKKGTLRLSTIGTFDSIHPYTVKGTKAEGITMCFDPLMFRNPEEPFTLYGCIAKYCEIAKDNSAVTFFINPQAKFSDGTQITAEDVKFTYEYLLEQGLPRHKHYYSKIEKIEILDRLTVKLTFKTEENGSYNPELPFNMSLLLVLPKHYLKGKVFEEVDFAKIPTSGAYKISSYELGRFIEFEKNKDHWALDIPTYKGMNNFEKIKIDYYKTTQAQFLAFQAGEFDIFFETNPNNWETGYDFNAIKDGKVAKEDLKHERPVAVKTIIFNMKKKIFSDWKIRKAVSMAFDFDTINKMLFANSMQPADSLFANTFLCGTEKATSEEEKVLEQFKKEIPSELYADMINTGFIPARTNGNGDQRKNLEAASKLLDDAGWKIENGARKNSNGEILKLELMYKDPKLEKIVLSLKASLAKLGIDLSARMMDNAQYENRVLERDFDMIIHTWVNSLSPGNEQVLYFSQKMADVSGSGNYIGMKDHIAEQLAINVANTNTMQDLVINVHSLDRYVMGMHYQIPLFYDNKTRFAYWKDKIAYPKINPRVGLNIISFGWQPDEKELASGQKEIESMGFFDKIKSILFNIFN